jgi:hypothetical protein
MFGKDKNHKNRRRESINTVLTHYFLCESNNKKEKEEKMA